MNPPRYNDPQALRQALALADGERKLREAAAIDLGDYFRFTLSPARRMVQGTGALRLPVVALLGATDFARFHVDLVAELSMTGTPDEVPPLVPIELPGLPGMTYRAYPIVDHIADKVCALLEHHRRPDGSSGPSTRYRDLADLVTFAHNAPVDARELKAALDSETRRRRLALPERFDVPSDSGWAAGYARVARDASGLEERDLETALRSAKRFLDPVLVGTADGCWGPAAMAWGSHGC